MELNLNGKVLAEEAQWADVEKAWNLLQEEGFLILSKSKETYLQISGAKSEGFVLEYQEDSPDQNFNSVNHHIDGDSVLELLRSYYQDVENWRDPIEWERFVYRSKSLLSAFGAKGKIGLVIFIGALYYWKRLHH